MGSTGGKCKTAFWCVQVVVPPTFFEYTSRRVLTTGWLSGEKLSQSTADDVGSLVNIGVICYLKQLLDTGLFHADECPPTSWLGCSVQSFWPFSNSAEVTLSMATAWQL